MRHQTFIWLILMQDISLTNTGNFKCNADLYFHGPMGGWVVGSTENKTNLSSGWAENGTGN